MIVSLWHGCYLIAQYEVEPFDSDSEISIDQEAGIAYQYADTKSGHHVTRLVNTWGR